MLQDVVADLINKDEIIATQRAFDLNAPLTEAERLLMANELDVSLTPAQDAPRLRVIDEDVFAATDVSAVANNQNDYNQLYAHYLGCQALATIVAYEEGWEAFQKKVLSPYIQARKGEEEGYTGDDRDKIYALRLRRTAAMDFARYIMTVMIEAAEVPKPSLTR